MSNYRNPYRTGYRPGGGYRIGAYAASAATTDPAALLYDAQNIDGQGNGSLVDGGAIATWKNLGTAGAAHDLVQANGTLQPVYRAVAASGKLNNKSAVQSDGTKWMQTASSVLSLPQPCQMYAVCRTESVAGNAVFVTGSNGARTELLRIGAQTNGFAGTFVTAGNMVATSWHTVGCLFNGLSSQLRLDGIAGSVANGGNQSQTGVGIFIDFDTVSFPLTGYIVEIRGYTGNAQPAPADIEAELWAKYGVTPQ